MISAVSRSNGVLRGSLWRHDKQVPIGRRHQHLSGIPKLTLWPVQPLMRGAHLAGAVD
jgi:hypothetical protein